MKLLSLTSLQGKQKGNSLPLPHRLPLSHTRLANSFRSKHAKESAELQGIKKEKRKKEEDNATLIAMLIDRQTTGENLLFQSAQAFPSLEVYARDERGKKRKKRKRRKKLKETHPLFPIPTH